MYVFVSYICRRMCNVTFYYRPQKLLSKSSSLFFLLHTYPFVSNLLELITTNHTNLTYTTLKKHLYIITAIISVWQMAIFYLTGSWSYAFLDPIWNSLPYGIGYLMFCIMSGWLNFSIIKVTFAINTSRFGKKQVAKSKKVGQIGSSPENLIKYLAKSSKKYPVIKCLFKRPLSFFS